MAVKNPYHWGTGRRKTSVARIRLKEGSGQIVINKDRTLEDYFTEDKDRKLITDPLYIVDMRNRLDVWVNVRGGGFTGQAGAISQGIARALKDMFSEMPEPEPELEVEEGESEEEKEKPTTPSGLIKKLRDSGYLTRDGRMKERKKYGRKGARKSFQFSKR